MLPRSKAKLIGRDLQLIFEPGRAIVANAGVLVTEVEYLKLGEDRHFAIVDAAMNDLIRLPLWRLDEHHSGRQESGAHSAQL